MTSVLRRTEQPVHAHLWRTIREACSWKAQQWRKQPLAECRYPFCSCVQVARLEEMGKEDVS